MNIESDTETSLGHRKEMKLVDKFTDGKKSTNSNFLQDKDKSIKIDAVNLEFLNATIRQAGLYTCTNKENDKTKSFRLTVNREYFCFKQKSDLKLTIIPTDPPILHKSGPQIIKTSIGKKVTLTCSATAQPSPHFKWYRTGYEIFENVETYFDLSRLQVRQELQSSEQL
jgi:hypothetical protein